MLKLTTRPFILTSTFEFFLQATMLDMDDTKIYWCLWRTWSLLFMQTRLRSNKLITKCRCTPCAQICPGVLGKASQQRQSLSWAADGEWDFIRWQTGEWHFRRMEWYVAKVPKRERVGQRLEEWHQGQGSMLHALVMQVFSWKKNKCIVAKFKCIPILKIQQI